MTVCIYICIYTYIYDTRTFHRLNSENSCLMYIVWILNPRRPHRKLILSYLERQQTKNFSSHQKWKLYCCCWNWASSALCAFSKEKIEPPLNHNVNSKADAPFVWMLLSSSMLTRSGRKDLDILWPPGLSVDGTSYIYQFVWKIKEFIGFTFFGKNIETIMNQI